MNGVVVINPCISFLDRIEFITGKADCMSVTQRTLCVVTASSNIRVVRWTKRDAFHTQLMYEETHVDVPQILHTHSHTHI